LKDYHRAAEDFETARTLDPENPALSVNYRGLHSVDTVVLCAAGEEPAFGPIVEARPSGGLVLGSSVVTGISGIPLAADAPASQPGAVRTSTRVEELEAWRSKERAPVKSVHGVPLQAADLEHSKAGLRGWRK
jgi:hypothetical protein